MFGELRVHVHVAPDARDKPAPGGPLIFYWNSAWHPDTRGPSEVLDALGQEAIDEVVAQGGLIAAPYARRCDLCQSTGTQVWFGEDLALADRVVACALTHARIDTRHIHAVGWSAGALQAVDQLLLRAKYMASAVSYSGGLSPAEPDDTDSSNRGAVLLTFGNPDYFVIGLRDQSLRLIERERPLGRYLLACDHGGAHEIDPLVAPYAYRFLRDHPYKVTPEPYLDAVPDEFPSYCKSAE